MRRMWQEVGGDGREGEERGEERGVLFISSLFCFSVSFLSGGEVRLGGGGGAMAAQSISRTTKPRA